MSDDTVTPGCRMSLKVLPLDAWMQSDPADIMGLERTLQGYRQIDPVFSRPGRYLRRCHRARKEPPKLVVWFELPDGRAFLDHHYNAGQYFLYDIAVKEAGELMPEDVQALAVIYGSRYATVEQRRLYDMHLRWQSRRRIRLQTISTVRKYRKERDI